MSNFFKSQKKGERKRKRQKDYISSEAIRRSSPLAAVIDVVTAASAFVAFVVVAVVSAVH